MEFVTNILDLRTDKTANTFSPQQIEKHFSKSLFNLTGKRLEDMVKIHSSCTVGEPKPTETCTTEQLKEMGLVGLYKN